MCWPGFAGVARAAEAAAADFWNTDNWSGRLAVAAVAVAAAVAAHNWCDIAGCIVVERRADCIELVLRESAYRLAAEAPDLFVLSVDTETVGFAAIIEAQWVMQAPNSVSVAAEGEQSDRDTAARPISA